MAKRSPAAIAKTITITALEQRPFVRLQSEDGAGLPREARKGLALLQELASAAAPRIARSVVDWTLARDAARRRGRREAPPISVLNRRRRAARSWVEAILAGQIDAGTNQVFATAWMPQLAGTGPDLEQALPSTRELVELVRGAFAAAIFADPADNLVPCARAMHVVEVVLARELGALENAASRAVKNRS